MPSLTTLPPENLLEIAEGLESADCLNWSCCSHYFFNLLLQRLWRTVTVDDHGACPSNDVPLKKGVPELVDVVLKRPFLASYTRSLFINFKPQREVVFGERNPLMLDEKIAMEPENTDRDEGDINSLAKANSETCYFGQIREKVKLSCRSEAEERYWMRDIVATFSDAWTGLLLTLFPNITCLDIDAHDYMEYFPWIVQRAADAQFGSIPILNSLSHVSIR